ncbi:MAG: glycoside hydrolase family 3 N-terminal domain-containing protein [bacterium]
MKKLACLAILLPIMTNCAGTHREGGGKWVERTLASLSVEEKVGQMMAAGVHPDFYNQDDPGFQRLLGLVESHHLGGVMFYGGMVYEVTRVIQRLQEKAPIPLLVMADAEWGMSMRVTQSTHFPRNMAIGATGSESIAYEVGKMTAREGKGLGVHIAFAPVLDVNNNPDNLVINTRSYSDDPGLVARLGSAFIRGLQEGGLFATAKHFPGHGDTNIDSHLELPVVTVPVARLHRVELPPFQAAVDAGVRCVMTAHITYSARPQMQGRPATLDPYFMQQVLRQEMGFEGLIISDGMDMKGITNNYWSGEATVMAINAGVDIVLLPVDFEVTFEFVVNAVKEGRIPMHRIDEAVGRILQAKLDLGLDQRPLIALDAIERMVANPGHLARAEEIANEAVTLLRDERAVFPLHAESLDTVLVVTITDERNAEQLGLALNQEIMNRIPVVRTATIDARSTRQEVQHVIARTDSARAVVVGIFVKTVSSKGSITLPDTTARLLTGLWHLDRPTAVISFGSPYVIRQLPAVPSYLCAYETSPLAVRAATRALFGEIPIRGRLPVNIPGYYKVGDGLRRPARKMELVRSIQDRMFEPAYRVLEQAIQDSVFPGAQVAIVRDGQLIASRGFGRQTYAPASPEVDPETVYDLASVTKVVATTMSAMVLWQEGRLLLDVPVRRYLPEFRGGMKDSVTVRHLLTHSGGMHWGAQLWKKAKSKQEALDYIYSLPLDYVPGDSVIYSDLGLILLGEILQTVSGKRIDQLADSIIFVPLGLRSTRYNPPRSWLSRVAPTEVGGLMDRGVIHGEVHDENTFFFGGVSSHAGLFSTAEDLAVLAQMLLNGGVYRHHRFFWPQTIRTWTARQQLPPGSIRALGWTTPADEGASAGDYFSKRTFGHTGFTGTSIWIDPHRRVALILLTNRVHPTRDRGGIYQVRREFHNAAMRSIIDDR